MKIGNPCPTLRHQTKVRTLSVGFDSVVALQPLQRYLCIHGFASDPEIGLCYICIYLFFSELRLGYCRVELSNCKSILWQCMSCGLKGQPLRVTFFCFCHTIYVFLSPNLKCSMCGRTSKSKSQVPK